MRYSALVMTFAALLSPAALPQEEANKVLLKEPLSTQKDGEKRFNSLTSMVRKFDSMPIKKKDVKTVEEAAHRLLDVAEKYKTSWDYSNAVHHANLVIGRVSLMNGNMEEAKRRLERAGNVSGSPQLSSFGPNMTLAKEMLEKGEQEAVLKYLQACEKFWNDEHAKAEIAKWKSAISKGEMPDFGANLKY